MRVICLVKQPKIHLITFLVTMLVCVSAWSAPVVIVTNDNNPPFSFTLPDGTITGLYVEYWQMWSKYNNQPIDIHLKTFEESLQEIKHNNTIHSGLLMTPDRAQWSDFSSPIHHVDTVVVFNRNYPKNSRLKDFAFLKVAVYTDSFQLAYMQEHHPEFQLITYVDPKKTFEQLLNGEIDAVVAEAPFINVQLAQMGLSGVLNLSDEVLTTNTVHAMIAKDQVELLELINQGIRSIPIEEVVALEKKWLPSLKPFHKNRYSLPYLTIEENQWLMEQDNLVVGFDNSWYPIEFLDDNNQFNGIAADYISHFRDALNINFIPVHNDNWAETFEAFKNGEIDVLSAVITTEKRKKTISFTDPYVAVPTAILTRKNDFYIDDINQLKGKKLGLVNGFAIIELVQKDYPEIEIVEVESVIQGLRMLDRGDTDAYIGTLALINHELDKNDFDNLKIAAFSPYRFEIAMAIGSTLEPLRDILNKTIDNMTEKQKITIKNDWMAIYLNTGSQIRTLLEWLIPIIVLLLTTIIVILWFNKKLQTQIDQRKAAEKELKHLATHDVLTNLPNWRNLEQQFNHIIVNNDQRHALLFIDLDGFKKVNDTYGHKAGDTVLVETANRLKVVTEQTDIVVRIGGDEFLVLVTNLIDNKALDKKCQAIVNDIKQDYQWQDNKINISCSIGIAKYPLNAQTLDELISLADAAMYQAKNAGKNQFYYIRSPQHNYSDE